MKSKSKPEIFLFEFATCGGEVPDSILVEGLGMFHTMYHGFTSFASVNSFVREEFKHLFNLPLAVEWEQIFESYLDSEYSLIIAPEDDFLLLNFTKKIEKLGLKNLGSSSKAISITSDKWRLYKKLKRKVNVPKTSKKPISEMFIVKPRVSCGGEGITCGGFIKNGFIAQEYIEGDSISLSFVVGDDINLLSINEQLLKNFNYVGAVVPFEIDPKFEKETIEECVKTIDCIKGLFGYVGIDVVLSSVPYVIEVNARLTTPSVLFKDVYGVNLAEMIYENYYSRVSLPKLSNVRRFKLVKEKGSHGFISARGYSLVKYPV